MFSTHQIKTMARRAVWPLAATVSAPALAATATETLVTADIVCSPADIYQYDKTSKTCTAPTVSTLTEATCKAQSSLAWAPSGQCKVVEAPSPTCASSVLREALTFKDGQCFAQAPQVVSSSLNLVGDCVMPLSQPAGLGLTAGKEYAVIAQDKVDADTSLSLLPVNAWWNCTPIATPAPPTKVSAALLQQAGYKRAGWVYGALILPFKYHFHDKSFSNSASIGPYLGRRSLTGATSWTWALSAGITQLDGTKLGADGKALLDDSGKAISTKLAGFTFAAGLMFEVSKGASGSSPFKAGLFYGTDRVSRSDSAAFAHDRKPWMALQLGYDFTDN